MTEPKLLIQGKEPIYHVVMDAAKLGLTPKQARRQDMASEYAIICDKKASAGIMVYGKFNGEWSANPWSTRFLIRELLEKINIKINEQ